MNLERLRFFAGVAALLISIACAVAVLFVVTSGRDFAALGPALGWVGTICASLFVYSGLSNQVGAVHRQVNGNLEREVKRADDANARLADIASAATAAPAVAVVVPPAAPESPDTARHRKAEDADQDHS